MTTATTSITDEQRDSWNRNGFFRVAGFSNADVCKAMLDRVVALARASAGGADISPALVLPEANLQRASGDPEATVSKIFRLHRDMVFNEFAIDRKVTELLTDIVGEELDCFLSQFIFKNPGAWGQPWHQDSFYFPFEPPRPIAGVWLAVTEATLENGCLHVLPGSQTEPLHEHVRDQRPGANYGYMEIIDHDMSAAQPVLMQPGDLLVFDSHLMHRSTDNVSSGVRAAMVYHYCRAGSVPTTDSAVTDFMPARRV